MRSSTERVQSLHTFSNTDRDAVYRAIFSRRDVRGQFLPDLIPDEVLSRILLAAHHAPSVGFMQPWNFILVQDSQVKRAVKAAFELAHTQAAAMFPEEKRKAYKRLKLEGILEAPLNICITCDRERFGPVVIGRTAIETMDLYSSVCAVQNLWIAARAEGIGVGWVSIIDEAELVKIIALPDHVVPIAYLCMGYVSHFFTKPELESANWLPRLPLENLVYHDRWQRQDPSQIEKLRAGLNSVPTNALAE